MDRMQADREELEKSYRALEEQSEAKKGDLLQEMQQLQVENRKLNVRIKTAEQDIQSLMNGQMDSEQIITRTELVKMKEEMDQLRVSKGEAVQSKLGLLRTSSLEIERMRDEIRLLVGDRKVSLRDFNPGRYDSSSQFHSNPARMSMRSVSSLGSAVPLHSAAHQQIFNGDASDSYLTSAWTYTLGMLSSIGSVFPSAGSVGGHERGGRSPRRYHNGSYRRDDYDVEPYDIRTEYDESIRSSMSPRAGAGGPDSGRPEDHGPFDGHVRSMSHQSRHHHEGRAYGRSGLQNKHSRHLSRSKRQSRFSSMGGVVDRRPPQHFVDQPSMAGPYANNVDGHFGQSHSRGLSAGAFQAKRRKRTPSSSNLGHQRKASRPHPHPHPHSRSRSRHRTKSNMSMQSLSGGGHRPKQLSKQEILLDSTDNEIIRNSMASIFEAFDDFETTTTTTRTRDNHIDRRSQELSGVASGLGTSNALNRFGLADIADDGPALQASKPAANGHARVSSTYHSDYMRKPRTVDEERQEVGNGDLANLDQHDGDFLAGKYEDFWGNIDGRGGDEEDTDRLRYSDDERFGMPSDFSGDAAVQGL